MISTVLLIQMCGSFVCGKQGRKQFFDHSEIVVFERLNTNKQELKQNISLDKNMFWNC